MSRKSEKQLPFFKYPNSSIYPSICQYNLRNDFLTCNKCACAGIRGAPICGVLKRTDHVKTLQPTTQPFKKVYKYRNSN